MIYIVLIIFCILIVIKEIFNYTIFKCVNEIYRRILFKKSIIYKSYKNWEIKNNISIYYINLDKSIKRNIDFLNEFKRYSTNINRINAINPEILNNQFSYLIKQLRNSCGYNSDIELACFFSHLKTIHTAYHNGDELALICEDDIIVDRMPYINNLLKYANKDWDILQMVSSNFMSYKKDDLFIEYKEAYFSAGAYIINKNGMMNILETFLPGSMEIKHWDLIQDLNIKAIKNLVSCVSESIFTVVNTYTCTDLFFLYKTEDSTIHEDQLFWHKIMIDKITKHFEKNGYKYKELGYRID